MTDDDVQNLYRSLLGRPPESPDTVAAFKAYYGAFERGRAAILHSAEFSAQYSDIAGAAPSRLAQAFLRRAGGAAAADHHPAQRELAGTMRLMLRAHGKVHLAVVAGDPGMNLADLLPLEGAGAAVLHTAPSFPAFLPQLGELPGGATVFRIRLDAAGLREFLRDCGMTIDVLVAPRDATAWLDALRPAIAGRAILLGETGLALATQDWPGAERAVTVEGFDVRQLGAWFLPVRYTPAPDTAPPPHDAPALWLAAIVRDEQDSVVNMLQSVAPIASGFVLVDTGSSDETLSIARAYLQTVGKPFLLRTYVAERFDDMRNAALDLVPGDAAWVLMLDADEELCAEDHAPLLDLLRTADRDAYSLPRYNYPGLDKSGEVAPYPDRQVRLLRHGRVPPIRYQGAVHEKVRDANIGLLPLDATVLGQGRGGPHIHHLVRRFRSPEAEARKQARYLEISAKHE
jgi:hypothetical protein